MPKGSSVELACRKVASSVERLSSTALTWRSASVIRSLARSPRDCMSMYSPGVRGVAAATTGKAPSTENLKRLA